MSIAGSLELTTALLVYLFGLVLAGTVYQLDHSIHETTARFFDAWFLTVGPLPMPAGQTLFLLSGINLLAATVTRIPLRWDRVGVLLVHIGLLLLVVGGVVSRLAFRESVVALSVGDSTRYSYDLMRWDLEVTNGDSTRYPVERLGDEHARLPFEIVELLANAALLRDGPGEVEHVSGARSMRRPEVRREQQIPGLLIATDGRTILIHGSDPIAFEIDNDVSVRLLPRRYELPSEIRLREFTAEFYPGTSVPRSFRSSIDVVEGSAVRQATLTMNSPLRIGDYSIYQSGYDLQDGVQMSLLQVVRNRYRILPYVVGALIAAGLALHVVIHAIRSRKSVNA